MAALRAWFAAQRFLEVETGGVAGSPGNETHLHAFATELIGPGGERRELYLRTSPEFACKKLLAVGRELVSSSLPACSATASVARCTIPNSRMLEWYRAHEPYETLMDDCAGLLAEAARAAGTARISFPRQELPIPLRPPERLTVAEAFSRHAGIDLLATVRNGKGDRAALAAQAMRAGIAIADNDNWADIFSRVLVERVDPHLGVGRATILYEYPLPLATLARAKPGSDRVAERFELYACGVELANAFGELRDTAEQRARFEAAMAEKEQLYNERYPVDEDLLAALAGMPPASGIALGFDRLVMLATGAQRIDQVIWAPVVETTEGR